MKKIFKLLFISVLILNLSSCKNSNLKIENILGKNFEARDNGYISINNLVSDITNIDIKYPDYCLDKQSGVIVDTNGNIFKKPDYDYFSLKGFNLKLEVKNGKTFINSESMFYENNRFELIDEFTILDTLLDIKYVDNEGKYNIKGDTNEYINEFKELKNLSTNYNQLVNDYIKYKDQLSPKVREGLERELALEKDKNK